MKRREFLHTAAAGACWMMWPGLAGAASAELAAVVAPPQGGRLLEANLHFAGENYRVPAGVPIDRELDGREFTDLSTLQPASMITPTDRFYIRTRASAILPHPKVWPIKLHGLVEKELAITAERIDATRQHTGTHVLECSGNAREVHFGMLSCARWEGVPLTTVLKAVKPTAKATRVLVSGFDRYTLPSGTTPEPGCSWIFTFDQLKQTGAALVTRMNGAPLVADHGAPVRLQVPNWYGCTNIKWVDEIKLVGDDEPATTHMQLYYTRTHQTGNPKLAREYTPAQMDLAAMPVRVEKWQVGSDRFYRVIGVQWGVGAPTSKLAIRFAPKDPFVPVTLAPTRPADLGWMLWAHVWRPRVSGLHVIELRSTDPGIRTRRLDMGFYRRAIEVEHV
ncbi:MAG: molybdopterin-dependent oxidoreductase [Candidatus Xenobia bacterium]